MGHGNFIFMKISQASKLSFINFMEKNNIFIRDYGHIKETENYVRITIGNKEQMLFVSNIIDNFEKTYSP